MQKLFVKFIAKFNSIIYQIKPESRLEGKVKARSNGIAW